MLYPYLYLTIPKAIPRLTCQKIIEQTKFHSDKEQQAQIDYHLGNTKQTTKKIRDAKRTSFTCDWIYREVGAIVENVNKKHWNFDLHWVENLEYLKYGKDGHFDWHVDQALNPYTIEQNPNPNFTNRIRKLSVSVQLSESEDYEGGNLELENPFSESLAIDKKINTLNTAQDRSIGTLIIFPSFVRHRVTPIKKGLRQSLVLWYLGDRYR
tara:strand:- start:2450 stop:3079 length:630 start_codon:yes stop_codon:yes gene_type:complete